MASTFWVTIAETPAAIWAGSAFALTTFTSQPSSAAPRLNSSAVWTTTGAASVISTKPIVSFLLSALPDGLALEPVLPPPDDEQLEMARAPASTMAARSFRRALETGICVLLNALGGFPRNLMFMPCCAGPRRLPLPPAAASGDQIVSPYCGDPTTDSNNDAPRYYDPSKPHQV